MNDRRRYAYVALSDGAKAGNPRKSSEIPCLRPHPRLYPLSSPRRSPDPDLRPGRNPHSSPGADPRPGRRPRPSVLPRLCIPLVCLLLLALSRLPCRAQDDPPLPVAPGLNEETILFGQIPSVFSASKYEQKSTEAPSRVTIVTANEIRMYGYRTLSDILQSVPGVFVNYDRNYSYVGVRGFGRPGDYNTRILLLLDGRRMNDNVYDMAPVGTEFPVDVDLIDRVEVVRGPGSSLYGANAFLGVVNVITKRGRDLKGSEASGEVRSHDTHKGRVSYGDRFQNGWESLFSASYLDSGGQDLYFKEFDAPAANNGIAEGADNDRSYSFFTKHSFGGFAFSGAYQSREKGIPTASYETVFNDSRNETTDDYLLLDLRYEHVFENQPALMARAYFDRYRYDGTYAYAWPEEYEGYPGTYINKDHGTGEGAGAEFQITGTVFEKHKLIAGMEYRNSFTRDQDNFDVDPFTSYLDDRRDSFNWGGYAQDEFRICGNLILNAGVRYDYYDTFGSSTNPRAALIFLPTGSTALKLIYGEAFRPPNAYELYYQDSGMWKAALDLKPEKIRTYELLWEQYIGNRLRLAASGFYYTVDNLISLRQDPADGMLVFDNIDEVDSKGVELELDGKWTNGIEGRISYTYEDARDSRTGDWLTNSPRHMAKFNVIFPLVAERLFAGAALRYMSARSSPHGEDADPALVADLTLLAPDLFKKGFNLSASVYNLFDTDYGDPASLEHQQAVIMQDGIGFRLKAVYSF